MANSTANETNIIFEIIKIVATAVFTGLFTYWITFKKDREEKKYHAYKELLEKGYTPIVRVINDTVVPGDVYEGLDSKDISTIIQIVEDNVHIVEPRLESFAWLFKEERNYGEFVIFDEDRKFFDYVHYRYNYLRKKLYLPYDPQYFFWGRQIRRANRWWCTLDRTIGRKVRSVRKKLFDC